MAPPASPFVPSPPRIVVLGRFAQADAIDPNPGGPQSLNRYSYVRNNPLRYVDPSGHCIGVLAGVDTAVCIGAGIVVGGAAVLMTALIVDQAVGTNHTAEMAEQAGDVAKTVIDNVAEEYERKIAIAQGITYAGMGFLMTRHSKKAITSMADHLGFMFSYDNGLPGFPDPHDRHDPNRSNSIRNNARHIRNSLRGIQRNLGNTDLRTFLQETLTEDEFAGLTEGLDNLVAGLQDEGWLYQEIGEELSQEILSLLQDMGYITP